MCPVTTVRNDPAAKRRRLNLRVSTLKRRFGVASLLGFGAIFGLVAQHAVGTQKHSGLASGQVSTSGRGATTFFDASGPGYSFNDSAVATAEQSVASSAQASPQQQQQQPAPVAQSSGS